MNSNLSVWTIQDSKEELFSILDKINKDSLNNILYLNCICRFRIGDVMIKNKRFDSCFYSEDSDAIIFFEKDKYNSQEIEEYLNKFNINYNIVSFMENEEKVEEDDNEMDISFIRDKKELEKISDDFLSKKVDMCLFYPQEKTSFFLGYKSENGQTFSVDGRFCKGTIVFKNKLALLVSQNDSRNVKANEAIDILEKKGITVIERGNNTRR